MQRQIPGSGVAQLNGAHLSGADGQYARLPGAQLAFAELLDVNLEGANLEGATYSQATDFPSDFSLADHGMVLLVDNGKSVEPPPQTSGPVASEKPESESA